MRRSLVLAAFALTAALPASGRAQSAFVAVGNYTFAMEQGYSGPDLTGLTVTFGADSTMVIGGPDGTLIVKSKLKWEGVTLTLMDQDGSNACGGPGKFTVEGTPASFRLKTIEDACPDRSAIIAGIRFVKAAS